MLPEQVGSLAAAAGRTILENGGEIYRVEETVNRLCDAFGFEGSQVYATPGMLTVSVRDGNGKHHMVMERITTRGVNLDKVDAVNQFSRDVVRDKPDVQQALTMLQEVRNRKVYSNRTVILFSALACAAFTLLFEGGVRDMLPAAVAGGLIRIATIQLSRIKVNDFLINAIGGAIGAFIGWLALRTGVGGNTQAIVTAAIMLLVPGLLLTNAVRDVAAGDVVSGISRMMEAFVVAIAIACGTALAYVLIPFLGGGALW